MEEMDIGGRIQEYRKAAGMSLRELAAHAEISPSMLSQIENNAVNPSINTLKSIAEVLQIPLYKFSSPRLPPLPIKLSVRENIGSLVTGARKSPTSC